MLKARSKRTISIFLLSAACCLFLLSCENPFIQQILEFKTVLFNTNGGSSVPTQNLIKGQKITRPADPRKGNEKGDDDIFEGWYLDNLTFENEWIFDNYIPSADMVLYAKWFVIPENRTEEDRWSKFVAPGSTAELEYEFNSVTGVCTITVYGEEEINYPDKNIYNNWKARANYLFTAQANTHYTFVIEAWAELGAEEYRWMGFQYYYDEGEAIYRDTGVGISEERKTYTFLSEAGPIIKGGARELRFQSADKLGTFYVKIISITPAEPKMLAISGIQNFLYDDGMIGLFSAETTEENARDAATIYFNENWIPCNIVASLSLSVAEDVDDSTANFPLKIKNESLGNVVWWTEGGGSYKIGMLVRIGENTNRFFWLDEPVDFSNAVTTIQFNQFDSDW